MISNIDELRCAQKETAIRLKHTQTALYKNVSSVRDTLHLSTLFIKICGNYLSLASHINFYHRGYLWLRSLLLSFKSKKNGDKEKQSIVNEN
jgi:hypothetical protein